MLIVTDSTQIKLKIILGSMKKGFQLAPRQTKDINLNYVSIVSLSRCLGHCRYRLYHVRSAGYISVSLGEVNFKFCRNCSAEKLHFHTAADRFEKTSWLICQLLRDYASLWTFAEHFYQTVEPRSLFGELFPF